MQVGNACPTSRTSGLPLPGGLRPGGWRGGGLSPPETRTEPPLPPSLPPPPPPPPAAPPPPPPPPPPSPRASAVVLVAHRVGKLVAPSARTNPSVFASFEVFM